MTENNKTREKVVAIVTGVFSIGIGILYLLLTTILDSRGAMIPPPQEALGAMVVAFYSISVLAQ